MAKKNIAPKTVSRDEVEEEEEKRTNFAGIQPIFISAECW